jgi:hypothetical protein
MMLASLFPAPGRAAEWSLSPVVGLAVDQDSNRTLSTDGIGSSSRVLSLEAALERRTPTAVAALNARLRTQDFDLPTLADDRSHALGARYRWAGERIGFSTAADVSRQSTLATDLVENPVFGADLDREDRSASLSASRSHSERLNSQLSAFWSDTTFDAQSGPAPAGFRFGTLGLQTTFGISPRFSIGAVGSASRQERSDGAAESRNTALRLSLRYSVTDRTLVAAEAGVSRTRDVTSSVEGRVGRLTLTHQGERGKFELELGQNEVPSDFGVLVRRAEAAARYDISLGERLTAGVAARQLRDRDFLVNARLPERRVDSADVRLDWRVRERWALGLNAGRVRVASNAAGAPDANGWRVGLGVSWTPLPRTVSR